MTSIALTTAMSLVAASLEHARQHELSGLAIVVLDAGGHLQTSVRGDRAGYAAIDIACAKARGALAFGLSSSDVGTLFGANPALCAALSITLSGNMLPLAGALLIRDATGCVVGAIAAAGASPDEDEAAAQAGLMALPAR